MIHFNLNVIFYTHVKHSPTKTIYIKYFIYIFERKKKRKKEEVAECLPPLLLFFFLLFF